MLIKPDRLLLETQTSEFLSVKLLWMLISASAQFNDLEVTHPQSGYLSTFPSQTGTWKC